LRLALNRNPAAKRQFDQLDGSNRYAISHRLQDAKKPQTLPLFALNTAFS
jgi:uncharacterized protein YdeI (YjbR/CyaY-like superfamily)